MHVSNAKDAVSTLNKHDNCQEVDGNGNCGRIGCTIDAKVKNEDAECTQESIEHVSEHHEKQAQPRAALHA